MNVNIWGPDFWNVLHAVAILTNEKNQNNTNKIFELIKDLLPCIFCLRSYRTFYDQLKPSYKDVNAEFSYKIHDLVNEKLLKQKIEILTRNNISSEKVIRQTFTNLTETNFMKRVNLYNIFPLNPHSLYRMILILIVALDVADDIEQENNRLNATYEFILQLSNFLIHTVYSDIGRTLHAFLRSSSELNTEQLFVLLSFYQNTSSQKPISLKYFDNLKQYKELFLTYKEVLLAHKCAINTCQ